MFYGVGDTCLSWLEALEGEDSSWRFQTTNFAENVKTRHAYNTRDVRDVDAFRVNSLK